MTFIGRDGRLKKNARRHHYHAKIHHFRHASRLPHGTNRRRCFVALTCCNVVRCSEERCSVGQMARCSAALPVRWNGVP
jgi:hypothetical protein